MLSKSVALNKSCCGYWLNVGSKGWPLVGITKYHNFWMRKCLMNVGSLWIFHTNWTLVFFKQKDLQYTACMEFVLMEENALFARWITESKFNTSAVYTSTNWSCWTQCEPFRHKMLQDFMLKKTMRTYSFTLTYLLLIDKIHGQAWMLIHLTNNRKTEYYVV